MAQLYITLIASLLKEVKDLANTTSGLAIVVFICCAFWFSAYMDQAEKQQDKVLAAFEKANGEIVSAIKEANKDIDEIKNTLSLRPIR